MCDGFFAVLIVAIIFAAVICLVVGGVLCIYDDFDETLLVPGIVLIIVGLVELFCLIAWSDAVNVTNEATTEECGSTGENNDTMTTSDTLSVISSLEDQITILTEQVTTLTDQVSEVDEEDRSTESSDEKTINDILSTLSDLEEQIATLTDR